MAQSPPRTITYHFLSAVSPVLKSQDFRLRNKISEDRSAVRVLEKPFNLNKRASVYRQKYPPLLLERLSLQSNLGTYNSLFKS